MKFVKWYQQVGGDEQWKLMLEEHEAQLISQKKPAFTTILAADYDFEGDVTAERMSKVKYKGDLYVDFDAKDLEEVIPQFQKFLRNLQKEYDFDLNQAKLFASGGKGFHLTIPMACFVTKPSNTGYQYLPAIFKEMIFAMYFDTVDMAVYTARKGRMFRTANVERPDKPGVFKVPLTVDEAFSMTPELYRSLCGSVRMDVIPSAPTVNLDLAIEFEKAVNKVTEATKVKKKSKVDANLIKSFKGQFPPSVVTLMEGKHIRENVGFQKIALQLSLLAHTLGKSEEQLLEACEGLCKNHSSDGQRYNTPGKRTRELARMYQYMQDNPCYEFSMGGIRALIDEQVDVTDLRDGGTDFGEDMTHIEPPPPMEGEFYDPAMEPEEEDDADEVINLGIKITTKGIWRKSEEGMQKVCALGLGNPRLLKDLTTNDHIGYEVDTYIDGKPLGPKFLTMDTFLSRQKFMQFTLSVGGVGMSATDQHIGGMADILRFSASKRDQIVYTTPREGLDVIVTHEGEVTVAWVDRHGVSTRHGIDPNFKLRTTWTENPYGDYKTDLRKAPDLVDSDNSREFFKCLLDVNDPQVVAKLLGWFVASFFCQIIRYKMRQFPLLMVEGQAGSGKSTLTTLIAGMHYWRTDPKKLSAANQRVFGLEVALSSTASLPMILEEFKPREMKKDAVDRIRDALRHNYEGQTALERGRVSMNTGQSQLETRGPLNAAPIVFVGEAPELQAAIQDRVVHISMSHDGQKHRSKNLMFCQANREYLSSFGRSVVNFALRCEPDEVAAELYADIAQVTDSIGKDTQGLHRVIFNNVVTRFGLTVMKNVLEHQYGPLFNDRMQNLIDIINPSEGLQRTMSEIARVLNVMSQMSYFGEDLDYSNRIIHGEDYVVTRSSTEDTDLVELNLIQCYTKYVRYIRTLGQAPLYDNAESFVHALKQHKSTVDTVSSNSPLKKSSTTRIFSLSQNLLTEDDVGLFNTEGK